jgi:hypothetical protein
MKKIRIKLKKGYFTANYTNNIFELIDGLFKDAKYPLLMEFHRILRPCPIDTNSRRSRKITKDGKPKQIFALPIIDIITFNPEFKRVRLKKDIENDVIVPMLVEEKYVLEVPKNLRLDYKKIRELRKLEFEMIR